MSDPKAHHFLPQFYLRGFEFPFKGKREKILVYPKQANPCNKFIANIEETACQRDYNTLDVDDNKDRRTIESKLSEVETVHSPLVKKIIENENITEDDKQELAFFINLMQCRVPSCKKMIEDSHKFVVKSTKDILDKKGMLPPMPDILKKYLEKTGEELNIEIYNWKLLEVMFQMASNQEAINTLSAMNFSLIKAPEDNYFITSDSPVSYYLPSYKSHYGLGMIHKKTEIFMPISNVYGILCSWKKKPAKQRISKTKLREYNRRTIIMADNYIYSSIDALDIIHAINKYRDIKAGYKLEKISTPKGNLLIHERVPVIKSNR